MLVVHCRRARYDVYVGRAMPRFGLPGSKWGNPYRGDGAIRLFEQRLRATPRLLAALPEVHGKVVGCWCAPNPCHGDVIVRLANTCLCDDADKRVQPFCVLHPRTTR